MSNTRYEDFLRSRITELRMQKNISEHKMSLDLDRNGSYIRGITSGIALPSVRELFNIIDYFGITPAEFFAPLDDPQTSYARLCERLRSLDEGQLAKIDTFVGWMETQ